MARHWYEEVSQVVASGSCRHVNRQAHVGTQNPWEQMCLCHHMLSWGHGTCANMPAYIALWWCWDVVDVQTAMPVSSYNLAHGTWQTHKLEFTGSHTADFDTTSI